MTLSALQSTTAHWIVPNPLMVFPGVLPKGLVRGNAAMTVEVVIGEDREHGIRQGPSGIVAVSRRKVSSRATLYSACERIDASAKRCNGESGALATDSTSPEIGTFVTVPSRHS